MKNRVDVTVGHDPDYHYVVTAHPEGYCVTYHQNGLEIDISFGSLAEMEEVAQAMLAVVKIGKEF